jgi:transcriptional regulator with GAF, ATPase, and Fis domain
MDNDAFHRTARAKDRLGALTGWLSLSIAPTRRVPLPYEISDIFQNFLTFSEKRDLPIPAMSSTIRAMTKKPQGSAIGALSAEEEKQRDSVLEAYSTKQISRTEAARMLGVTERHLSRLMKARNLTRAPSQKVLDRERVAQKRQVQRQTIIRVLKGTMTIEKAAEELEVSTRQVYRMVKTLGQEQDGRQLPRSRGAPRA